MCARVVLQDTHVWQARLQCILQLIFCHLFEKMALVKIIE